MHKLRISKGWRRRQRGFSIIELLVAIIIIGILVTVLIPVISSRTEQARQARVATDLEIITEALNRVAIDTGYYVRLFALNDRLQGDNIAFDRNNPQNDTGEGLTDYLIANPYYGFQGNNGLFINPATADYSNTPSLADIIGRFQASESRYTGGITWSGPYMNLTTDNNLFANIIAPDGIPDDPWGNNYLLFTEAGMVLEPSGAFATTVGQALTGGFTAGGSFNAQRFDRPTALSLGPNGVPGSAEPADPAFGLFGEGDDFSRPFGN